MRNICNQKLREKLISFCHKFLNEKVYNTKPIFLKNFSQKDSLQLFLIFHL